MLFSVIVPIYKVEEYLDKCIQSILQQTYNDFELILVDDGSPDRCSQICDNYQKIDNRVKVIHKENGGVVSARQVGVEVSRGEYLVFVDGDDWVAEDFLCSFSRLINDNNNPDIVCCGHIEAKGDRFSEKFPELRCGYYTNNDIKKEIFPLLIVGYDGKSFSPTLWAKAFLRKLYQQYQLTDAVVIMGEDEVCVKPCVFHANSMIISNDCLYYYRQNMNSISQGTKPYLWDGPVLRGEHLKKHIDMKQYDFQAQLYRHAVRSLFTVASSQFRRCVSYRTIVVDIKNHLKEPYYVEAIKNCKFKIPRDKLILWSLKYNWFWFMKLFCKIKL